LAVVNVKCPMCEIEHQYDLPIGEAFVTCPTRNITFRVTVGHKSSTERDDTDNQRVSRYVV
jgi:hypothetical protein